MPNNGSSIVAGLSYFAGNPSSADLKAFDEPAGTIVIDLTSNALRQKKAAQGTNVDGYSDVFTGVTNSAAEAQAPVAATRTYITGSNVSITAGRIAVGTLFRWRFGMTKTTNAGIATSTIDIAFGTAGTTADTARVSFTKPAGTALADEGFVEIEAIVTAIGTSGVVTGEFRMIHNLASTGHMQIPAAVVLTTSSAFNTSTVTDIGLCITTGASDAITIGICTVTAQNL